MTKVPAIFLGGPLDGLATEVAPREPFAHWCPQRIVEDDLAAEYIYVGFAGGVAHYRIAERESSTT